MFWIILKYGQGRFWKVKELVPKYSEAQIGSPVTYIYSFADIRRLLKDFEILEIRKEHIFPYEIEAYKRYEYKKVWYFRWMPRPLFRALEKILGWHTLVVAKLKI